MAAIVAPQPARQLALGLSAIALAVAFNVPYSILAMTYNYPDVLRGSAADALNLFAQGGPSLILTWHAFALIALALMPFAMAVSLTKDRLHNHTGLAIGAAVAGALAGLTQAMGLWRWVFVIPSLAHLLKVTVETDFAPLYLELQALPYIGVADILPDDRIYTRGTQDHAKGRTPQI
jgi:hypothetical protein